MTAKELLKPRFKIIADYPGNDFGKIGTILNRDWTKFLNDDETQSPIWKISDYPHLFRKLNWWEERDVSEMPKKVSSKFTEPNQIYLIEEWDMKYLIGWTNKAKRKCVDLLLYNPEFGYFPID